MYYFVELDEANKNELDKTISDKFSEKRSKSFVVKEDCNVKLTSLASFLKKNKDFRVLAFIDPYGMSLNWSSIQVLKNLGIDLWILVPTGIGMNRLLTRNGEIRDSWLKKLEMTLGIDQSSIKNYFYKTKSVQTLFGEETFIEKEKNAIEKAGKLYQQRLRQIFKYVSNSFPLKNSTGSVMYHFMMASNNKAAFNIANDIIKPKKK